MGLRQRQLVVVFSLVSLLAVACGSDGDEAQGSAGSTANGGGSAHAGSSNGNAGSSNGNAGSNHGNGGAGNNTAGGPGLGTTGIVKLRLKVK